MILHQWKGLSDSVLKIIALVFTIVDHIAYYLMEHGNWTHNMIQTVGRMVLPVFALLLVEGHDHTRSTRKYTPGLLVFVLISEIPRWLLNHDNSHNVFFTFLLGLTVIGGMNKIDNKPLLWCVLMITTCAIATSLHVGHEYSGTLLICAFHIFQPDKMMKCFLITSFIYRYDVVGLWLDLVVIYCYNRQRGFIKGQYVRYLCHVYYPLYYITLLLYVNFSR